jgi:hypothetical protein
MDAFRVYVHNLYKLKSEEKGVEYEAFEGTECCKVKLEEPVSLASLKARIWLKP